MKLEDAITSGSMEGSRRGVWRKADPGRMQEAGFKEQLEVSGFLRNEMDKWRAHLMVLSLCFTIVCDCFEV